MAYSSTQWETVKAFYERGLSLAEIVARAEVDITDRSSISKKAKEEGWVKGKNSTLVQEEVLAKSKVKELVEKNQQMNSTERAVHNVIVSERMADDIFFRKANMLITRKILQKVQVEDLSVGELKTAIDGVGKGQENIYPRKNEPSININNTNAQQTTVDLSRLSDTELRTYAEIQAKIEQA